MLKLTKWVFPVPNKHSKALALERNSILHQSAVLRTQKRVANSRSAELGDSFLERQLVVIFWWEKLPI